MLPAFLSKLWTAYKVAAAFSVGAVFGSAATYYLLAGVCPRCWEEGDYPFGKRGLKGIPIMGLLDDLLMFEDGTASPYDYKSSKGPRDPEYARTFYEHQTDIYEELLAQNGFKTHGKASFSFWSPKEISIDAGDARTRTTLMPFDVTVHTIESSRTRAQQLIKAAVTCLNGPMPGPDEECEMCEYLLSRRKFEDKVLA